MDDVRKVFSHNVDAENSHYFKHALSKKLQGYKNLQNETANNHKIGSEKTSHLKCMC